MPRPVSIMVLMASGLFGACATGMPTAPSVRMGYIGNGVYRPTVEEQAQDCKQLSFLIEKSIKQINAMPATAQKQRAAPPPTLARAISRMSGGELPIHEEFEREHARLRALGQLSASKGCPPVDFDGQTKVAAEQLAALRTQ